MGRLGDPVPPLALQEWINGQPFRIQPGTNLYVVVFCTLTQANDLALTSALSALENRYRDQGLMIVAVSSEAPEQLRSFVQSRSREMDFAVAADASAGRSAQIYQQTFGQVMLPRAYLVGKDARLIWYGNPLTDGLGAVVDEVMSGRYDPDTMRSDVLVRQQLEQYVYWARQGDPRVAKIGQMFLRLHAHDAPDLCRLAYEIANEPGIEMRDAGLANAALDRAAQLTSTNAAHIAVIRAELDYQTGHPAEGLSRAKAALESAQTEDARDEVQTAIRDMEMGMAGANTNAAASPAHQP